MGWQAWEEREYAAWMRMASWSARTSSCKRGLLSFSTKRFSSQTIKKLSIVNLPFPCAIMTSRLRCRWRTLELRWSWFRGWLCVLRCWIRRKYRGKLHTQGTSSLSSVFAPAADGAESVWEQWKIRLDIACLCGAKQTAKHKAYKLYTWFKFSVTAHWRNIAKYIGLENTTLERFIWRVQSDSDGVARSPPLSRKKKVCKHQSYAKRCILNAQRHKTHSLIIACTQRTKRCGIMCQEAGVGVQAMGTCSGPELGENTSHLEKNIIVLGREN